MPVLCIGLMVSKPIDRAFEALPKLGLRDTALIWTFVNALTFDFKPKEQGGNPIQYVMVMLAFISGGLLIFQDKRFKGFPRTGMAVGFLVVCAILNFVNIFIANSHPTADFDLQVCLRSSPGFLLAPLGMGVVYSLGRRGLPMSVFTWPIAVSAVASTVFRFYFGRALVGFAATDTSRWEILGPLMWLLVGYGLAGLLYARKFDWIGALSFAIFLFITLASATRSLTIGLMMAAACVPILLWMSGRFFDRRFMQRLGVGALGMVAVSALALFVVGLYRPDGFQAILNRQVNEKYYDPQGNPVDITLMLRQSQLDGMTQGMRETPYSFLFGKGSGVPYTPDRYYEGSVPFYLFVATPSWFSDLGLSYLIYTDGWVVGGALVFFMFVLPFVGIYAAAKLSKRGFDQESLINARAALALIAFWGLNLTWAGTYERPAMLMFGILGGICLVSLDRVKGSLTYMQKDITLSRRATLQPAQF